MKPLDQGKTYTFLFAGQCLPGFETDAVELNLAKLFGVSPEETKGFFSGESCFLKTDLEWFALQQYLEAFSAAGALCRYMEQKEGLNPLAVDEPAPPRGEVCCPKCGHVRCNGEECENCGIVFKSYRRMERRRLEQEEKHKESADKEKNGNKREEKSKQESYEGTRFDSSLRKSKNAFKFGAGLIVAIFLIDGFAQDRALDIGYAAYLVPSLFFAYGGWHYAKSKGYSPWVGLSGLLSIVGLAVLYLLPNRLSREASTFFHFKKILAMATILIGCHWCWQFYSEQKAVEEFLVLADRVEKSCEAYPSGIMVIDSGEMEKKRDGMIAFIDAAFTLLTERDHRPRKTVLIAEALFREVANYFIWLNYQQFLQIRNQGELEEYFTLEAITEKQADLIKRIGHWLSKEESLKDNMALYAVSQRSTSHCLEWDYVVCGCASYENKLSRQMKDYVISIFDTYQRFDSWKRVKPDGPSRAEAPGPPRGIVANVAEPEDRVFEIRMSDNNPEPVKGTTLVLAYYGEPTYREPRSRYDEIIYLNGLKCIGGDFPTQYLTCWVNVYNDWLGVGF